MPDLPDTPKSDTPAHAETQADAADASRRSDRRRSVVDTRGTGLERRRGPGRRRNDFVKAADEGEMSPEQFLFVKAVDAYKRVNNRPYPTWTEVLEVVRKLGYRKTQPMDLNVPVEDWTEPADAPAFTSAEAGAADTADT